MNSIIPLNESEIEMFQCTTAIKERYPSATMRLRQDLFHTDAYGRKVFEVYTDGACSNNGQEGAIGGCGVYFGAHNSKNKCLRWNQFKPTSQQAELGAIILALNEIKKSEVKNNHVIYTDSEYSINCLTVWYPSWQKNNWLNSKGELVANLAAIQECRALLHELPNVSLEKVKAHSGVKGNEAADKLAKVAIMGRQIKTDTREGQRIFGMSE